MACTKYVRIISRGDSWNQGYKLQYYFFSHFNVYAEAETPTLWPPHAKSWLIGKDSDAGRDWGQEEKGTTKDETAGWHHWLDRHESEWTPGVGDGQGGLACCDSWGRKESDMTEWLNWTHRVLKARILKCFAIPFSSGPCFVRPLHHDPSILDDPTRHGSLFSLS